MDFLALTSHAAKNGASDIYMISGSAPLLRVGDDIQKLMTTVVTEEELKEFLSSIMTPDQKNYLIAQGTVTFSFTAGDKLRYKINAYNALDGLSVRVKLLPNIANSLAKLNVPTIVEELAHINKGLVICCSPSNNGKSSTMAAIVEYINQNYYKSILVIGNPLENKMISNKCLISQVNYFPAIYNTIIHDIPDIIVIDEIRYVEAMEIAIMCANRGHLVFVTITANSASKAIDDIANIYLSNDKWRSVFADCLEAVIFQRLLPRKEGNDRVGAFEVILGVMEVKKLIQDNTLKQIPELIEAFSRNGMVTMKSSIDKLIMDGIIDPEILQYEVSAASIASKRLGGEEEVFSRLQDF